WLEQPAPRGGRHGINRYVFYRVSRERPDVLRAYPDLDDDDDGAGFVAWCWSFGRVELAIPDRFMPPWAGNGPPPVARSATVVAQPPPPQEAQPAEVVAAASRAPVAAPGPADAAAGTPPDELAVRLTGYMGHTLG